MVNVKIVHDGIVQYVDASTSWVVSGPVVLQILPTATRKWASTSKSQPSGQVKKAQKTDKKKERSKNRLYLFSYKMI